MGGRALPQQAMHAVTLYTRDGCHLCEVALTVLDGVRAEHPFTLEIVDIETDPALKALYALEIPVVLVNGRKTFKYRVDRAVLVDRLTRGEP